MNRVAIVTGAARGIGAATVDALVNDGYHVVAVDRCRDIPEVPYAMATPAELESVVARQVTPCSHSSVTCVARPTCS